MMEIQESKFQFRELDKSETSCEVKFLVYFHPVGYTDDYTVGKPPQSAREMCPPLGRFLELTVIMSWVLLFYSKWPLSTEMCES